MLSNQKILVTGASGMLGKALLKRLFAGNEVLGVSKTGREKTFGCDLSKKEEVDRLFKEHLFHLVIHSAAYSDVDGCERDPKLAHESNALATKHLSQNCGLKNTPFIYISTDYVFDGQKKSLYEESGTVFPINFYGMTKLAGEYYTKLLAPLSVIVRTSWLFGAGNPGSFVNAILERLKKEKVLRVLEDQVDSPTFVVDLSAAIEQIGEHLISLGQKNPHQKFQEIFHFCNTGSTTRLGMALQIKEILGLTGVEVERVDKKDIQGRLALRPLHCVMSTAHFRKFFNASIRDWKESLKDYLCEHPS